LQIVAVIEAAQSIRRLSFPQSSYFLPNKAISFVFLILLSLLETKMKFSTLSVLALVCVFVADGVVAKEQTHHLRNNNNPNEDSHQDQRQLCDATGTFCSASEDCCSEACMCTGRACRCG